VLSFTPSQKIEKALKYLQGSLIETYQNLIVCSDEEKQYLNKSALISNVGASTRIENAVLTDIEIEWVDTILSHDDKPTAFDENKAFIIEKLSKDREKSIEEVVGTRDVLTTIYLQAADLKPLTENTIRGLHYDLLKYYPAASHYAGQYKTVVNKVVSVNHATGVECVVLEPTDPGVMTDIAMNELVQWYNKTIDDYHWPILVAIEFVFRFLAIHPFQDGNGRIGRALFLLILLQSDDKYLTAVVSNISIDRHIERNKMQYYTVLEQCSNGKYKQDSSEYQYDNLVFFFLKMFNDAIEDITLYRKRYANYLSLSETALTVLNCFKSSPEKRLKIADVEAEITIPRRTIQYALKTLSEKQFLQKLGDGTASRYQLIF
jgi:Fic family protein